MYTKKGGFVYHLYTICDSYFPYTIRILIKLYIKNNIYKLIQISKRTSKTKVILLIQIYLCRKYAIFCDFEVKKLTKPLCNKAQSSEQRSNKVVFCVLQLFCEKFCLTNWYLIDWYLSMMINKKIDWYLSIDTYQ